MLPPFFRQRRPPSSPSKPAYDAKAKAEFVAQRIGAKIQTDVLIHLWHVDLLDKLCERIESLERSVKGLTDQCERLDNQLRERG